MFQGFEPARRTAIALRRPLSGADFKVSIGRRETDRREHPLLAEPGRTRTSATPWFNANGRSRQGDRKPERREGRTWTSTSFPLRRPFNEVGHGLPSCPKLRLALGHVVPERYVSSSRVIHHPLQQSRGHQFLGDAREPWVARHARRSTHPEESHLKRIGTTHS